MASKISFPFIDVSGKKWIIPEHMRKRGDTTTMKVIVEPIKSIEPLKNVDKIIENLKKEQKKYVDEIKDLFTKIRMISSHKEIKKLMERKNIAVNRYKEIQNQINILY